MRRLSTALLFIAFLSAGKVARAQEHFGAIAYSPSSGAHGYAFDFSTQAGAEARALAECNSKGRGCQSAIWFRNACGAIAVGSSGWGSGWDENQQMAEQKALDKCKNYSRGCSVVRWVCTTGRPSVRANEEMRTIAPEVMPQKICNATLNDYDNKGCTTLCTDFCKDLWSSLSKCGIQRDCPSK
jgi:hypothetical protein